MKSKQVCLIKPGVWLKRIKFPFNDVLGITHLFPNDYVLVLASPFTKEYYWNFKFLTNGKIYDSFFDKDNWELVP